MDLVNLIYRGLYDSLATVDISGGVLLAAIWFQTGYVALFRAIHGPDACQAPAPAQCAAAPPAAPEPGSAEPPWGAR